MSKIIVIRHAKSDWNSFNSDFDRGINDRGYKSCKVISEQLKKKIDIPSKFMISPAKRACLTFEEIFFSWYSAKQLNEISIIENKLYYGSVDSIVESIKNYFTGVNIGVIVGHNPLLSELIFRLSKINTNLLPQNLVTCGCVIIDYKNNDYLTTNFSDGVVLDYLFPKQFLY